MLAWQPNWAVERRLLRKINNVTRSSCSLSPSPSCYRGSEVWFVGSLTAGWIEHSTRSHWGRCIRYRGSTKMYKLVFSALVLARLPCCGVSARSDCRLIFRELDKVASAM